MTSAQHILILGAGYAGFNAARGLRRAARAGRARITVVDPQPYMTYKPLLPEVAGGETAPRDVTVMLQRALPFAAVIGGAMSSLDATTKTAVVRTIEGTERPIGYDQVILALGSITRAMPIPGLDEHGIGFSTLEEAVYLRNHVLDRIRFAAATTDPVLRERALTFVFIGGGYTGVEAITELYALAHDALTAYPQLTGAVPHWLLVEVADRVAVELESELSKWTLRFLRGLGIDVRLTTEMTSCNDGVVELSSGDRHPADTIVWSAGVVPNPALDVTNVPRGSKGHARANARLQVIDDDGNPLDGVWAIGDNAQVPDLTAAEQSAYYPPNAQNALRQARLVARNIEATLDGAQPREYRHVSLGTLASYGPYRGAAKVKGVGLRGLPAWAIDKVYHAYAMPNNSRRVRIVSGWVANALAQRDLTSTSATRTPRGPFMQAMATAKKKAASKKKSGSTKKSQSSSGLQ
jgi:NADH:ubiquinone reductase (H+-translocating)